MSSSINNNPSRKGKGRQKTNMVKIENETNLQVTFSKRRAGLFKKASELSTLCGAETAIVVFSPGNKAHSFGHPNVDTIANRFLNQNVSQINDADKLLEAHQKASINQQNLELAQIHKQLELERKRAQELERVRKEGQHRRWCPPNIDKLDYQQLGQLKGALLQFRHQLESKVYNATSLTSSFIPITRKVSQKLNHCHSSFDNKGRGEKLVLNGTSSRVQVEDGGSAPNASVRINPKENNPNVHALNEVAIPYDPMASGSSFTIPYSSTATISSVNNNEH